MKVLTTDGIIVEKDAGNVVYLAMIKAKEGYWYVSGIFYHSPEDVERGNTWSSPSEILIVKVIIPEEMFP